MAELQGARERHRDEIRQQSEGHDTRLREFADRASFTDTPSLSLLPRSSALGRDARDVGDVGGRTSAVTAAAAAASAAATTLTPVALAVVGLAEKWHTYAGRNNRGTRRSRSASTAAAAPTRGLAEPSSGAQRDNDGGGGGGRVKSEGQLLVGSFLRETVVRLDAECARAVRHARVLEWELRGARQEAADAAAALEEARVDGARWSARTAVAEAALTAASHSVAAGGANRQTYADPTASVVPPGSAGDDFNFNFGVNANSVPGGRTDGGGSTRSDAVRQGTCTAASVSLLEKRLAAAMEDLVATGAARAAAEAGETLAAARAGAAEAEAMAARVAADMLGAELERHKASVSGAMATEAADWRREIRSELGRWWNDGLVSFCCCCCYHR